MSTPARGRSSRRGAGSSLNGVTGLGAAAGIRRNNGRASSTSRQKTRSPKRSASTVTTAAAPWANHIHAGIAIPESASGSMCAGVRDIISTIERVVEATGAGAPSMLNSPWKMNWLNATEMPSLGSESDLPARAMHTIPANARVSATPTGPGTSPPASACEHRATKTETAAAIQPRVNRAHRVVMIGFESKLARRNLITHGACPVTHSG